MGPPELLSQFPILEEAPEAMGVVVWPIVIQPGVVGHPDVDRRVRKRFQAWRQFGQI
jgi:hypothetical protein